jgi:hypothetical protein
MLSTDGRLIRYYIVRELDGNLSVQERTDLQMSDWLDDNPEAKLATNVPFATFEDAVSERTRLQKQQH